MNAETSALSYIIVALLLAACKPASKIEIVDHLDCSPFAGLTEIETFYSKTKCATLDSTGTIQLDAEVRALFEPYRSAVVAARHKTEYRMQFPQALVCMPFRSAAGNSGGWAYLDAQGRGRFTDMVDNNCQPFLRGINHGFVDRRIVFFDETLNVLKRTDYRFARGRIVCTEIPQRYYRSGTYEHAVWRGGTCGRLNDALELVVSLAYPFEAVPQDR